LFGDVVDGEMVLNELGKIVYDEWIKTAEIRNEIELDEFIVMPNHIHGIIFIVDDGHICDRRGDRRVAPTNTHAKPGSKPKSIGSIMTGFKSAVTKRLNEYRKTPGAPIWQRNYWEHIIRDEHDLNCIREYIMNNPLQWELDDENPNKITYGRPAGRPHHPADHPKKLKGGQYGTNRFNRIGKKRNH